MCGACSIQCCRIANARFTVNNMILPIQFNPHGAYAIAWSPNSKYLATGGDSGMVGVWDASNGSNIHTFQRSADTTTQVTAVAWSPDGSQLASGGGNPNTSGGDTNVYVWDAITGRKLFVYRGHSAQITGLACCQTACVPLRRVRTGQYKYGTHPRGTSDDR